MDRPQIAITGSSGFVGAALRQFLSDMGIGMISLARKRQRRLPCERQIVFSDLAQPGLPRMVGRCDALIHLIGAGAQTLKADYESANVQNVEKAIRLCKQAKIKKIVYISGLGVRPDTTFGYFLSKLKAEQLIKNSGLDYTIFRASYIIGKNDPLTKNLERQAKSGIIMIPGSGSYRLQPISVSDVSRILLNSISNSRMSCKTVDLVGPQTVTFERFVKRFAKRRGVTTKRMSLEMAYFEALNRPAEALYGLDDLNILVGDFVSGHQKLERLCGFGLSRLDL